MTRPALPIDDAVPAVRAALADGGRAVLQAPPGAGKTTALPLALHTEAWAGDGRIILLEPRRLAARAAARRMASMNGDHVGGLVGFRVRGQSLVGPTTRIEVVTEGVLTRMLATDATLEGVSAVIFDEFHERNLIADVGLALTLQTAELVRTDLRLLVMSATLDGDAVGRLLGGAPVIRSQGRAHPVELHWTPPRPGVRPVDAVAAVVRRAIEEHAGDVLVFLPGAAEIRRIADTLCGSWPTASVRVIALHGSMSAEDQDAAIAPSPQGSRKVVLATSIAETSLTIEGVRIVVDSGLARVPRFDARSGMTRLETVRVTRDAADQRCGRAGRTAPGICYRLWTEGEHATLLARRVPEILSADLTPLLLDLAVAGVTDPASLRWLDQPPVGAMAQARDLLEELDALTATGAATPHGTRMAKMGLHPRLAHLVLRGFERGTGQLASELAALLTERDVLYQWAANADPDLVHRVSAVRGDERPPAADVDRGRLMRVREEALRTFARARDSGIRLTPPAAPTPDDTAELLALAYPDRVALRAGVRGRFRMRNGRGAVVAEESPLAGAPALAIAETDGAHDDARVYLAAEIAPESIERLFAHHVEETEETALDEVRGMVLTTHRRSLGALVLRERVAPASDLDAIAAAFTDKVRRQGMASIPWSDSARRTRARLAFLHTLDAAWPDVSDAGLLAAIDRWLAPTFRDIRRWDDLARTDLGTALLALVPPHRHRQLDELAPSHIEVATGSRIPVDYSDPNMPSLSVRMQELYGTSETPRVGAGHVAVTLHLLSPAGRPLQVTRDLSGFWNGSYAEVRKEMRGRYPRHEWPDNPGSALATRRAKPRSRGNA